MLETLLAADAKYALGVEVAVLSRDPAAFARKQPALSEQPALRWVRGSVVDFDGAKVAAAMNSDRLKFDVVVHLATEADNAATLRDPKSAMAVIAGGTQRVLDFARASGVRKMLFTSSGSVFARIAQTGERMTEEHPAVGTPLDQKTAYGISGQAKRVAEALCAEAAQQSGLGVTVARCFTFAGPGMPMDGKFAYGNFLRDSLAGRPITILGDGTPVRSYLYATDLSRWLWMILLRGTPGRVYNVGSENAVSVADLARVIARETGGGSPPIVRGKMPPNPVPDFYVPSTVRARGELGLAERVELAEAIRRTANWLGGSAKH
jgi:dTDP-glucose 4,6-dehydratase